MLNNGFLYAFKEKEKTIFVVPTELIDLYKKYVNSDEKKECDIRRDYSYLMIYMLIYGIVPKEMIEKDIPNIHHFNISKKQIKEYCKENFKTYNNGAYYAILSIEEERNEFLNKLIESQNQLCYKMLNELEIDTYFTMLENFYSEMTEVLKNRVKEIAQKLLTAMLAALCSLDEALELANIPKNKKNKVCEVLENYHDSFRYWPLGGKTIEEVEFESLKQNMILNSKLEDETLNSCLKHLSKNGKKEICEYYECTKDSDLSSKIEVEAWKILEYYDEIEIQILIEDNKTEAIEIEPSLIKSGIVYLYYEDNVFNYLIPTDVIHILKSVINNLDIQELVSEYVDMNGIIEKSKVQELLKTYHNINLSIKELDNMCSDANIAILEKKYYTFIEDFPKEELSGFINQKNMFSKYKKVDMEASLEEKMFRRELLDSLKYDKIDIMKELILLCK